MLNIIIIGYLHKKYVLLSVRITILTTEIYEARDRTNKIATRCRVCVLAFDGA